MCMEPQIFPFSQDNLKKEVGSITLSDFKIYFKATVMSTLLYWNRNRHINQWDTIGNSEMNPDRYDQVIFDKGAKEHIGEKTISLINGVVKTRHPLEAKLNRTLISYSYKNQLKMHQRLKNEGNIF